MTSIERRLKALEQAEWDRVHALTHRQIWDGGYIRYCLVPTTERWELEAIVEAALDERGYLDHRRLTPAQQKRGRTLLDMLKGYLT